MNTNDFTTLVFTSIVSALVGGGGLCGILFWFIKRYLNNKLNAREKDATRKKDIARRRKAIIDEKEHAEGRLFFWIHKAIVTGEHNGDLENAYALYEQAEAKEKELDREIIVESETS